MRVQFGAPSLQRNSRPAGWAESSYGSVILVSLCRFLSKTAVKPGPPDDMRAPQFCFVFLKKRRAILLYILRIVESDEHIRRGAPRSAFRVPPPPLLHSQTQKRPGRDRIALISVLKGPSHAHSHRVRGAHTRDVTPRPRNSLTAQTGTDSDCRVQELLCRLLFIPGWRRFKQPCIYPCDRLFWGKITKAPGAILPQDDNILISQI